jgi:hypothetical protein
VLLLLFTLGLAFLLTPLLLVGNSGIAYGVVTILGLVFGLFITFFVKDMEALSKHHHAGIWIVVLLGSLISFAIFSTASSQLAIFIGGSGEVYANSVVLGLLFSAGFFTPYFLFLVEQHYHSAKKVNKK